MEITEDKDYWYMQARKSHLNKRIKKNKTGVLIILSKVSQ